MSTRKVAPKRVAISCASVIMCIDSARRLGSVATMSSVARVSALIGLKQRLPHSFSQISLRMSFRTGASKPAASSTSDRRMQRSEMLPIGLAERELVAVNVPHHAGLDDLGGRIDHAADRPLRPDRRPLPVRPDRRCCSRASAKRASRP